MLYTPALCLLLTALAWSQVAPAQLPDQSGVPPEYRPPILRDNDEQQALPASASKVAPNAAVITIKGVCAQATAMASPPQATCETVISREQFEKLTDALLPNMKLTRKRQVAHAYPSLLAMAREAQARGLDKSPRFQERLAFAQVQILSQELVREIGEQAANVPAKDIEDYYQNHFAAFRTAIMERIFIPNRKGLDPLLREKATPDSVNAQRNGPEDSMTRLAQGLRGRAVAGEDFTTLQKEGYAAAGATDVPPNPSLGQIRPASLPPLHASAFNMKPGEVSQVINDPTGHYIYKLDSERIEPLEEVKDEIRKMLENQRREEAIQAVQRPITTELNPAYFGPPGEDDGAADPKSK
jgi:hypothetical protein